MIRIITIMYVKVQFTCQWFEENSLLVFIRNNYHSIIAFEYMVTVVIGSDKELMHII